MVFCLKFGISSLTQKCERWSLHQVREGDIGELGVIISSGDYNGYGHLYTSYLEEETFHSAFRRCSQIISDFSF